MLDLSGLWIARRRGRVVGAMLTQALAGRAAAVWPPEVVGTWTRPALAAALVREALDDLPRPRVSGWPRPWSTPRPPAAPPRTWPAAACPASPS